MEGTSFLFRAALAILKLLQPSIMKLPVEDCFALLTGSVRMESVWREEVSSENLFATIQKIKFSEKQQGLISSLVENAFFYEEGKKEEEEAIGGRKREEGRVRRRDEGEGEEELGVADKGRSATGAVDDFLMLVAVCVCWKLEMERGWCGG